MGKTVLETFTIFPFSIVLALALGEAFKQAVAEHRPGAVQTGDVRGGDVQRDRMAGLLAFLLLILPFYQGMNRYLLETYGHAQLPAHPYSELFMIGDGIAFMAESAIFFAMSRNLAESRWPYFYSVILVLMLVDSVWGASTLLHACDQATSTITKWIALNVVTALFLGVLILWPSEWKRAWIGAWIGVLIMLIRAFFDYWFSWNFYFGSIAC